ncbi:MAG TPA: ribosome maturation factor RimM, partial [Candidatus Binataceae bacterium]|nr:ribosome maturation factor RimM [Candidatus Binataceae bacterium]
ASPRSPDLIGVGVITGVHGLRGALRMHSDNPDAALLEEIGRILIASPGDNPTEYKVFSAAALGRGVRLELEGVTNANQAESLRGAEVFIAKTDLPPAQANEFYHYQVVGCSVVLGDGSPVGTIEEVFSTGANDVFVVRDGHREVLVPVIADVVKSIDVDARRVTIEAVPGLLD